MNYFIFLISIIITSCIQNNDGNHPIITITKEIIENSILEIRNDLIFDSTQIQTVHIVDGNSMVFYFKRYEDHGNEGWGNIFVFQFPKNLEKINYFNNNHTLILSYGTGFIFSKIDTVKEYNILGIKKNNVWIFDGSIANQDISGTYKIK